MNFTPYWDLWDASDLFKVRRIVPNWLEEDRLPSPQPSPPGEGGLAARRLQVQFPLLGERQGEGERASSFVLFLRLALMSR